jgi:hypothetical protein
MRAIIATNDKALKYTLAINGKLGNFQSLRVFSLIHLPPMTHFQNNQLRYGMFHPVDDSIIADAILETALPFIALHCLMLDEFRVFPHPFQFVEQTRPYC